jgi:hypothetical protein
VEEAEEREQGSGGLRVGLVMRECCSMRCRLLMNGAGGPSAPQPPMPLITVCRIPGRPANREVQGHKVEGPGFKVLCISIYRPAQNLGNGRTILRGGNLIIAAPQLLSKSPIHFNQYSGNLKSVILDLHEGWHPAGGCIIAKRNKYKLLRTGIVKVLECLAYNPSSVVAHVGGQTQVSAVDVGFHRKGLLNNYTTFGRSFDVLNLDKGEAHFSLTAGHHTKVNVSKMDPAVGSSADHKQRRAQLGFASFFVKFALVTKCKGRWPLLVKV